MYQHVQKQGTD